MRSGKEYFLDRIDTHCRIRQWDMPLEHSPALSMVQWVTRSKLLVYSTGIELATPLTTQWIHWMESSPQERKKVFQWIQLQVQLSTLAVVGSKM
jgi:hypothetical protein